MKTCLRLLFSICENITSQTQSQSKCQPHEEAPQRVKSVLLDDVDELGCGEAFRNVDAFADGDLDEDDRANFNGG